MLKQPLQSLSRLSLVLACLISGCSSIQTAGNALSGVNSRPQNIALLLPTQGQYADSASAVRNGFFAAYYADKQSNPSVANVSAVNTGNDVRSSYAQAVQTGSNYVVGPLTKSEVSDLANGNVSVPTLALNEPTYKTSTPNNLYFFSLSPRDEAIQVAKKAAAAGHHNAIIIASDTAWSQNAAIAFAQAWQSGGGSVVGTLNFAPKQNLLASMGTLLHVDKTTISSKGFKEVQKKKIPVDQLRRQDFDMVFLVASPQQARLIKPLLNFYFAGNIPVYATSSIYSGKPTPQYDNDLNGIIFCDMPWILLPPNQLPSNVATLKSKIATLWPNSGNYTKLYAMGIDAYYLTQNLGRLNSGQSLNGATGTLYLGPQHQISRQLIWAQMRNGVPAVL